MNLDSFISAKPNLENLLDNTGVTTLVNSSIGKTVLLVGVQHIGTLEYYSAIYSYLERMDKVLYEFLDDASSHRSSAPKNDHYQNLAQTINCHLGRSILMSQHRGIDYVNLPRNWHKADLSYQELEQLLSKYLSKNAEKGDAIKRFKALLGFFAEFNEQREGKLLTTLEDLELDGGVKTIGILYGSEHLPKIEQILIERGYKKADSSYLQPIPEVYHSQIRQITLESD